MNLAKECLDELVEIIWYRGLLPEEGRAIEIIERYLNKGFSAADIRVFLANNLPCYENEDGFIFLAKSEDIERIAIKLYDYLVALKRRNKGVGMRKESASRKCAKCGKDTGVEAEHYYGLGAMQFVTCPHCGQELVSDYRSGYFAWFSISTVNSQQDGILWNEA